MNLEAITPLSLQLLDARGFKLPADILRYIEPVPADMPQASLIPGLEEAVLWWVENCQSDHPILIYGDYDVDGVISTAIFCRLFTLLGFTVERFVPHRVKHGYGLKLATLQELQPAKYGGILILDSGTEANDVHAYLRSLNIPHLVLDHHEPMHPVVPLDGCTRIVNTHAAGVGGQGFCTGAISYLFAACLLKHLDYQDPEFLRSASAAASIAVIGDVCPLVGPNHTLVKLGLKELADKPWPGLRALMQKAQVGWPTATQVAWKLAPRLNAAGRIDDAQRALDLLLAERTAHAESLAAILEEFNVLRRSYQDKALATVAEEAKAQAAEGAIVIGGDWPLGIVGIMAGRLAASHQVPACVLAQDPSGIWNGSARAPEGLSLLQLFGEVSEFMLTYGGHAAAAGLHVKELDLFRSALQIVASSTPAEKKLRVAEATITAAQVNSQEAYALEQFSPFGIGNPEPLLQIVCTKLDGAQGHDSTGSYLVEFKDITPSTGLLLGHIQKRGGSAYFSAVEIRPA